MKTDLKNRINTQTLDRLLQGRIEALDEQSHFVKKLFVAMEK